MEHAVVARRWERLERTSESRSEEETLEELGDPVGRVLKETDPEFFLFLFLNTKPPLTLPLSVCSPSGHPPSPCHSIKHLSVTRTNNACRAPTIFTKKKKENEVTSRERSTDPFSHLHPLPWYDLWEVWYTEKRVVRSGMCPAQLAPFLFFWRAWQQRHC